MTKRYRIALMIGACSAASAFASVAKADGTVDCNVGAGSASTECGVNAAATGASATALGNGAAASGDTHGARV